MARALYVTIAAMLVMVAVPVSQLRTISVRVECCCPNPARCHCPEHATPFSGQASMKACHKSSEVVAGTLLPEFQAPRALTMHEPPRRIAIVQVPLRSPHAPPSPARPPRPS